VSAKEAITEIIEELENIRDEIEAVADKIYNVIQKIEKNPEITKRVGYDIAGNIRYYVLYYLVDGIDNISSKIEKYIEDLVGAMEGVD